MVSFLSNFFSRMIATGYLFFDDKLCPQSQLVPPFTWHENKLKWFLAEILQIWKKNCKKSSAGWEQDAYGICNDSMFFEKGDNHLYNMEVANPQPLWKIFQSTFLSRVHNTVNCWKCVPGGNSGSSKQTHTPHVIWKCCSKYVVPVKTSFIICGRISRAVLHGGIL